MRGKGWEAKKKKRESADELVCDNRMSPVRALVHDITVPDLACPCKARENC
jgi:hypothetical protein